MDSRYDDFSKYSTVRGFGGIRILKMNISCKNLHFPKGYDMKSNNTLILLSLSKLVS
jgi:hypothetical protein